MKGMKLNIRLRLSRVTGSDEKVIEQIEKAMKSGSPFGLHNEVNSVIFLPQRSKAFSIPTNGSDWTELLYNDADDFLNGVKLCYIGHKQWVDQDNLLGLAILLKQGNDKRKLNRIADQNEQLGFLSGEILPESRESSGSLGDGAN